MSLEACEMRPAAGGFAGAPWRSAVAVLVLVAVSACTTVLTRNPVPQEEINSAAPHGIRLENVRIRGWGDHLEFSKAQKDAAIAGFAARLRATRAEEIASGEPLVENLLALSGGGPDGAYGAGYLNGWTARGDRPEFDFVTGISTGSIVGVFAFLGPDYDDKLKEVYTTYTTDQLFTPTIFAGLTGGTALTDSRGYRRLIERYIDDEVVARLGQAFREGRNLFIGTTNIDAARPVIWSMGAIAASGHPMARTLIQDIIQASSAIPAAFPPVLIPVETEDGKVYDEMHVDGGATQQVMLFSANLPLKSIDEALGHPVDRTLYIIMNNKLVKPYEPVRPRLISIAGTAASSLIGGSGSGDIYRIFTLSQRDDMALNLIWIPEDFSVVAEEAFDPVYMKALYDLGYQHGLAGDRWIGVPPGYVGWPEEVVPTN
ncbi:MAG: patatin-like phospholipase family protein [Pseudomonadota bacterium]